ncbi:MAG: protein kinase [Deltaproteobacteria bacterium]|nr:protein kinase [Deltaproteobacteria bacterium]MBK9364724.1 protein kinase [Deltaproteobacteria bacterium]MBK9645356.1 protein kinase [Deltaproteobacteria bacterium]
MSAFNNGLPDQLDLLERLGEGTFGQVYVARLSDGAISRTVVLKVLKASWGEDQEVLRRARDEAALLARLNHDTIVRVEALTTWRGQLAVVMEHIQGLTLDRVLRESGPLPTAAVLEIIARVAGALDAAYNSIPPGEARPLRVVHRDIKPSNIILSVSGAVKVLDFGAARGEFDTREAATKQLMLGSPMYMAPEIFDGFDATPAVDVYALGATFYELLAGHPMGKLSVNPAVHAATLQERLLTLEPADLPDPASRRALRDLLGRMLRYDASRRPASADVRRLVREFFNRYPLRRLTLDQVGEAVVEPLFRRRDIAPPALPDGSMQPSSAPPITIPPPDDGATVLAPAPSARPPAPSGAYSPAALGSLPPRPPAPSGALSAAALGSLLPNPPSQAVSTSALSSSPTLSPPTEEATVMAPRPPQVTRPPTAERAPLAPAPPKVAKAKAEPAPQPAPEGTNTKRLIMLVVIFLGVGVALGMGALALVYLVLKPA